MAHVVRMLTTPTTQRMDEPVTADSHTLRSGINRVGNLVTDVRELLSAASHIAGLVDGFEGSDGSAKEKSAPDTITDLLHNQIEELEMCIWEIKRHVERVRNHLE